MPTVEKLIEILKKLPADAEVKIIYDGGARSNADAVYFSKGGYVCVSTQGETIYYNGDRPVNAPDDETDPFWFIPLHNED